MMMRSAALTLFVVLAQPVCGQNLSITSVNEAEFSQPASRHGGRSPVVLKAQVLLDRARFSPGVIDGYFGANVSQAIEAYEKHHGLQIDGQLDEAVWKKLTSGDEPVLKDYSITKDDANGPFVENIPGSFAEMGRLKRLSYGGPAELLAEKFHMDQGLLRALNPGVDFHKAGTKVVVTAVGEEERLAHVATVVVDKQVKAARAYTKKQQLVAFYPASIGSDKSLPPTAHTRYAPLRRIPPITTIRTTSASKAWRSKDKSRFHLAQTIRWGRFGSTSRRTATAFMHTGARQHRQDLLSWLHPVDELRMRSNSPGW